MNAAEVYQVYIRVVYLGYIETKVDCFIENISSMKYVCRSLLETSSQASQFICLKSLKKRYKNYGSQIYFITH